MNFSRKPSFSVFPPIHPSTSSLAGNRQEEPEHHPLRPRITAPCQCLSRRGEGGGWGVGDGSLQGLVRRGLSTSRASEKGRQLPLRICSIYRQSSNSPAGGNSPGVRMQACSCPRGCFAFKISSVCHTKPSPSLLSLAGVSALFTWGVIAENGSTHIAVVPGGWTEDQLEDPTTYLKVFPSNPFPNIPSSSAYGWDQLAPGRGVEVPGGGVHVRWGPDQGGGGQ